jgi:hypothetical protein
VRRDIDLEATLVAKYVVMGPLLNERTRRLWAAAESIALGFGGGDRLVGYGAGPSDDPERASRIGAGRDDRPHPPGLGRASGHRGHAAGDHYGRRHCSDFCGFR